jgi:hypothetical protein
MESIEFVRIQRMFLAYGRIEAIKAEIEAMKADNELRKLQGFDSFNYSPADFLRKAAVISDIIYESMQ